MCLKRTTCFSSNWPKYSCFIPLLTSRMLHLSLSQSVEYHPILYVGGDIIYLLLEAFRLFFWFYTMYLFFICNSIAFSSNMFDTSHPQFIKLGIGQRRVLHVWSNTTCNKSLNFKYIQYSDRLPHACSRWQDLDLGGLRSPCPGSCKPPISSCSMS